MSFSSLKFAVLVCVALAMQSTAAPTPTKRDGDVDAPGIPGWKPWYGVGPVIPSKAAGDDFDVDAPGIPGWNPHAGVGPVIPSATPTKVIKR
ncbi:hypothetical protein EYR40_000135 [Pleurotus pulmonarius]|nr:hypothetical protein EYR40_000135 [Pleurotus pulmonarius]